MADRYIALRTLKIGASFIPPGSIVERVNDGRDWDQMLRVGDVGPAPPLPEAAAGQPAQPAPQPVPVVAPVEVEAVEVVETAEVAAIEVIEETPGDWYCADCGRTFETEHGLRIHRGRAHGE